MDLGVGSFVFSSGLVSARTLLKNEYLEKTDTLSQRLIKSLRSSVALLVMGFIRLALTKGADYHVCSPTLSSSINSLPSMSDDKTKTRKRRLTNLPSCSGTHHRIRRPLELFLHTRLSPTLHRHFSLTIPLSPNIHFRFQLRLSQYHNISPPVPPFNPPLLPLRTFSLSNIAKIIHPPRTTYQSHRCK